MSKEKIRIQLSDHFTVGKLLRFTFPSMVMMLFASVYSVVDGFFVSNFVGKDAFTAVNLIFPAIQILACVGMMFGTGGSALIAKTFGEGDKVRANKIFSMIVYVALGISVTLAVIGSVFTPQIAAMLGAEGDILDYCITYGRIIYIALPFFILQNAFQNFLITAEKPKLGLLINILAGITNMVLDFLFVGVFHWGIVGAAVATTISQVVGGLTPLIYFIAPNTSTLRLGSPIWDFRALAQSAFNGLSEFVSNISFSIVAMLYNWQLLKIAGADGVAAYGIIQYFSFFFVGIFMGYCIGSAPIMGYHFGAQNHKEMKNVLLSNLKIISTLAVIIVMLAECSARLFAMIFVSYDEELLSLTTHGIRIYCLSFLLSGFTMYASSLFTSLNNGPVSAFLSLLRSMVFEVGAVLILPNILPEAMKLNGIWSAVIVAEILSVTVSVIVTLHFRKKYKYL